MKHFIQIEKTEEITNQQFDFLKEEINYYDANNEFNFSDSDDDDRLITLEYEILLLAVEDYNYLISNLVNYEGVKINLITIL